MEDKNPRPEIFKFSESDVHGLINHNLNFMSRFHKSFDYVYSMHEKLGFHVDISGKIDFDLGKVKLNEGKNYNWMSLKYDNVNLILRQYSTHITVFVKVIEMKEFKDIEYESPSYGAFTFYTKTDGMEDNEMIEHFDNPFLNFNKVLPGVIEHLKKKHLHLLWNPVSLPIPENCEIKLAFGEHTIYSVDNLIFCGEEISHQHLELFAENDMLEKLKTMKDKVGEPWGRDHRILEICTEFPKQYSDPYYHGVGIETIGPKDKKEWKDVYSLTQWYMDEVFK